MIAQSPPINCANSSLEELNDPVRRSDDILAQAILASWMDGVLILTEQGEWIKANEEARRICDRLSPGSSFSGQVPKAVWRVCQVLIHSREQNPDAPMSIDSELRFDESDCYRIRVRWFQLGPSALLHLLIILEDWGQSIQSRAIAEVDQYDLSSREAEVWLLHRTNYAHKDIAAELHISIHTVKKHMRSIRMKRRLAMAMEDRRPNSILNNG